MAKTKPRFCWDTCCFLSWLTTSHPERRANLLGVLQAAEKGEVELFASYFVVAETVYIDKTLGQQANSKQIENFFRQRFIRLVNVDWHVAAKARELQWHARLDPWDAVHLATAICYKADELHTYDDKDLIKCNGQIPGVSLRICHPAYSYQLALPTAQQSASEPEATDEEDEQGSE